MGKTLTEIIYQYRDKKFSWDNLDCCTFAANVVFEFKNLTPPDLREIENYKDLKGSLKVLKKLGCKDLSEAPSKFFNVPRKDIEEVKTGDIVYLITKNGESIGVCNGAQSYFIHRDYGLVTFPTEQCIYCWSIN